MLRPEDFKDRDAALAYANSQLDKLNAKIKDLESDMVYLTESPTPQEVKAIANKWLIEAQEAKA